MTKSIIGTFGKWLGDDHADIVNVDDVTPQIAEAYFLACRDTYKASSFNRHLAGLRGVWDTLQIAAGIDSNPFRLVKQIRKAEVDNETASKRDFSLDELRTMDEHATGWIRPGMFISFFTGLRLSDVVCLRWDEADIDGGFISIVSRKTSKPIVIYAPEAMSHLRAWRDSQDETGEYVFQRMASAYLGIGRGEDRTIATKEFQRFLAETCGFDTKARIYNISGDVLEALRGRKLPAKMCAAIESIRNRQMTDSPGLMTFTDALNKTGISKKHQDVIRAAAFVTDQTILGFHSLRVAHATYANRTGQSREDIQKRLQHSQSTTTDGYIKETTDEVRQKLIEDHVALSFAGEPVNRNGNGKTRDRISELVESMNAKNWKKVKTEILATLEI
jgi:integrase